MKRLALLPLTLFFLVAILLAACQPATLATTLPETSTFTLTFIGESTPHYLTLDDIKALPATQGMGGIMSSTGQISIPRLYRGIALKDLVTAFGDEFDSTKGLILTAEDGYSMTYSYDQVINGDFIAYDPALGTELKEHDPLTAILAYECDGQPLDPVQDGVLRVIVVSERNNQVTDGHWAVKWVDRVEIENIGVSWTLELEGAVLSPVDRSSFQSCGSPGCHGVEYRDDTGAVWEGVPLWLLVGEVDDDDPHSDYAFNDELADAGYTVEVIAGDGYTVTFDSISIKRNGDLIVAHLRNGSEIPEKYYPLRLIGPGLDDSQMVSQIARIIVHVPALPPSASEAELIVNGLVDQPLGLSEVDLRGSGAIFTLSTEHPRDGMQDYQGIRFQTLLEWVLVQPEADMLLLTAADGYSVEISLEDLQACNDCMVAFTDEPGIFDTVMPGFSSDFWIKNITAIEIK